MLNLVIMFFHKNFYTLEVEMVAKGFASINFVK